MVAMAMAMATVVGCRPKEPFDNPDVAAGFRGSEYEQSMVQPNSNDAPPQSSGSISPQTLSVIETTISNVYETDFERCLEHEMEVHETRFLRAKFAVQFTVGTDGRVSAVDVLELGARRQDATGADLGDIPTDEIDQCIRSAVALWEFSPPPEAVYVHTYNGLIGEAF